MFGKQKKVPQAKIILCKSTLTEKLYVGLFENNTPLKFWPYDDFGPAAKDFLIEIIRAYDHGYDLVCEFPVKTKEGKKIIPQLYCMVGEPGTDSVHTLNKRQALKPGQMFEDGQPSSYEIVEEMFSNEANNKTEIGSDTKKQENEELPEITADCSKDFDIEININEDNIVEKVEENINQTNN